MTVTCAALSIAMFFLFLESIGAFRQTLSIGGSEHTTTARVREVIHHKEGRSPRYWFYQLTFDYEVDGKSYQRTVDVGKTEARSLRPGNALQVRYSKSNPEAAILDHHVEQETEDDIFFLAITAVLGLGGLVGCLAYGRTAFRPRPG